MHSAASRLCWILGVLLLSVLNACNSELRVVVPDVALLSTLSGTTTLPLAVAPLIDGVYTVDAGASRFGDTVVLHHDGTWLSVFCQRNSAYMVMRSGLRDSSILYAGYWRYAQSPQTGLCTLQIRAAQGGTVLLRGSRPDGLSISGAMSGSESVPNEALALHYVRPLHRHSSSDSTRQFKIIAHRGGGRNSDRLPFSENSVELIKYASKLGAQGVEIDIRLTKDGVPVLYHDENFNTRLVDGEYMVGPVGNYTLAQIHDLCRLKNGEHVPTLDEVLNAIVDSTSLSVVWLDIKEVAEIQKVVPMQIAALQRARALHATGRRDTLEIFFGLATDEIYQAFLAMAGHENYPSICELGLEQTAQVDARVYAARWTLGSLTPELAQLHAQGRRAFVWTLDQPEFISSFLANSEYDGILSNYPTVVAYHYYTRP